LVLGIISFRVRRRPWIGHVIMDLKHLNLRRNPNSDSLPPLFFVHIKMLCAASLLTNIELGPIELVPLHAKSESLTQISLFFSPRLVRLMCPLSVLQRFIACVWIAHGYVPFHVELLSTSDRRRPFSALGKCTFRLQPYVHDHWQHWEQLRSSSMAYSHDRAYRS
jgi:hypothetical protein